MDISRENRGSSLENKGICSVDDCEPIAKKQKTEFVGEHDESVLNPWPKLDKVLKFIGSGKQRGQLLFQCLLCSTQTRILKCDKSSSSNLKMHLRKVHFTEKEKKIWEPVVLPPKLPQSDKLPQNESGGNPFIIAKHHSLKKAAKGQSSCDTSLVDFIINSMSPFSLVDQPSFRHMLAVYQPNREVISRNTLMRKISTQYNCNKTALVKQLTEASVVSTTTDCWTAFNRNFIGMTVHWISQTSLQRRYACLVCRVFKGSHTRDALAKELTAIHREFNISTKVVMTTTDNAAHFVKAFKIFGIPDVDESDNESTCSEESHTEDDTGDVARDTDGDDVEHPVRVLDLEPADGLAFPQIDDDSYSDYALPYHQKCACHTASLVATTDLNRAISESSSRGKRILRSALAKAHQLWNTFSRSPKMAEIFILEALHDGKAKRLMCPCKTRWNSLFNAVQRLLEFEPSSLDSAMQKMNKLPLFTPEERTVLGEYVILLKPVAAALDLLQSEKDGYLGILIPTIYATVEKLTRLTDSGALLHLNFLAPYLVHRFIVRFGNVLESERHRLASCFHPEHGMHWMKISGKHTDVGQQEIATESLKLAMSAEIHLHHAATSSGSSSDFEAEDQEDFYDVFHKEPVSTTVSETVDTFLAKAGTKPVRKLWSTDRAACFPNEAFKQAFIHTNVGVPSSAAVERLFSQEKDFLRPKWASMDARDFEKVMFIRANSKLK